MLLKYSVSRLPSAMTKNNLKRFTSHAKQPHLSFPSGNLLLLNIFMPQGV
jgi:hypothetical protein